MLFLQALLAVKPVAVEEEQETEVPTHPEDGTPQPGNSKVRRENQKMDCQWAEGPQATPFARKPLWTEAPCEVRGLCFSETKSHCV